MRRKATRPPDPARLPRRGRRADGGPEDPRRQGADPARGGPADHARDDHRGGAAGGRDGPICCWRWRRTETTSARPGSTSRPACSRRPRSPSAELAALLGRLEPAEILAPPTCRLGEWAGRRAPESTPPPPLVARRRLAEAFGVASLDAFGSFTDAEAMAAAMALDYVRATQAGTLPRLSRPAPQGRAGPAGDGCGDPREPGDPARPRRRHACTRCSRAVQRTLTAAGARLLAAWLAAPLTDPEAIAARQDAWSWLLADPDAAAQPARGAACSAGHRPRAGPAVVGTRRPARPRRRCATDLPPPSGAAAALEGPLPAALAEAAHGGSRSTRRSGPLLAAALADPAPAAPRGRRRDPARLRRGTRRRAGAARRQPAGARELQLDYAQRYGVASLKIRHHAQLGYVIEAPAGAVEKLRGHPDLTLRQGMANGARFTTPELSDLDRRIAEAGRARRRARARRVRPSGERGAGARRCAGRLRRRARPCSMSRSPRRSSPKPGTWCRPVVTERRRVPDRGRPPSGGRSGARRPRRLRAERLRPLAGPARAAAHRARTWRASPPSCGRTRWSSMLAQAGLPVPAEAAAIGVVDRLFSRVGAADDLARGR